MPVVLKATKQKPPEEVTETPEALLTVATQFPVPTVAAWAWAGRLNETRVVTVSRVEAASATMRFKLCDSDKTSDPRL
jgi:hypothetical protein